jgi:hypothetical protein
MFRAYRLLRRVSYMTREHSIRSSEMRDICVLCVVYEVTRPPLAERGVRMTRPIRYAKL